MFCPATELPLPDSSFDFVVSQFGVEYAGIDAFIEAARLVKPGGQLSLLCHYQDGYIDSKNQKMLEAAKIARHSNFISDALALVTQCVQHLRVFVNRTSSCRGYQRAKEFYRVSTYY